MNDQFQRSKEIIDQAIQDYQPYAIVMMFSGGDDSLTTYHVARALGVPLTHFLHGVTGTGIPQTTDFARQVGEQSGLAYIEANAGDAYEKYVWRKGFFGRGETAHTYAYHVLKHEHFEKSISSIIRQGRRNRPVLLVNGARWQESSNRKRMRTQPIRQGRKKGPPNIWVNLIHDWTKHDCQQFLRDYERNPVTELLCRSGECMCGTMQSQEQRQEAGYWFPGWGRWLDDLDQAVKDKHGWGWGEPTPNWVKPLKAGQRAIPGFLPMCHSCEFRA